MDGSLILERLGGRRRVLLLQGPMGPFFDRLAVFLRASGCTVHKVNLNGGDDFFYRQPGVVAFRDTPDRWPSFVDGLLERHRIDAVLLFGDCRPYHRSAILRARTRGVAVFVFEEGYIRPNYVTFEMGGVNAYSMLPRFPELLSMTPALRPAITPPSRPFQRMAWYAAVYYLWGRLRRDEYRNYRHHKPFEIFPEAWYWMRSAGRKLRYRVVERGMEARLTGPLNKRFFLAPLQVFNDSQIRHHSDYRSVRGFIAEVIASFAKHAPADVHLVFKQHPMDRGHRDYRQQIARNAAHCGVSDRVHLIHDQHLPSLLKAAIGAVMVNSTVGLSALFHACPVKLMGRAIYDMPGLVFEGPLERFWTEARPPDPDRVERLRHYLIETTQIGGSFYSGRKIRHVECAAGPAVLAPARAVGCAEVAVPYQESVRTL